MVWGSKFESLGQSCSHFESIGAIAAWRKIRFSLVILIRTIECVQLHQATVRFMGGEILYHAFGGGHVIQTLSV